MRWPKVASTNFTYVYRIIGVVLRFFVGSVFRLFTFVFRLDVDG